MVVGCDTGGGGDIWATSRSLGSLKDWFPPPPVWTPPVSIAASQSEIYYSKAVAGPGEQFNVFWNQADKRRIQIPKQFIYKLEWGPLVTPVGVLSSPEGKTGEQAVNWILKVASLSLGAAENQGRSILAGQVANEPPINRNGLAPQEISTPAQGATSPDIITNQARDNLYCLRYPAK